MIEGRKILTVDDSEMVRMMIIRAFMPLLVDVIEADNGAEGLTQTQQERPDLIFLDITMPVMDGIEMLQRLKADPVTQKIPVVMLTAESGRAHMQQIISMGACAYLNKPFKGADLLKLASQIFEEQASGRNFSTSPAV